MSRTSRKLSVKKETLRQLDANQLGQVHGGNYTDWVILKHPTSISGGCTTGDVFALNYYRFYY